jgi:hypothetical protein
MAIKIAAPLTGSPLFSSGKEISYLFFWTFGNPTEFVTERQL